MAARGIKKFFVTGLTELRKSTGEAVDDLGDIRFENGKIYKYVDYNEATISATAGDVVVYKSSTGYAANMVTGDYSEGGVKAIGAGVIGTAISTSERRYTWIQIKGRFTVNVTLGGTATDGSPLTVIGAADKALNLIGATAATENQSGIAEDASAKVCIADFPF